MDSSHGGLRQSQSPRQSLNKNTWFVMCSPARFRKSGRPRDSEILPLIQDEEPVAATRLLSVTRFPSQIDTKQAMPQFQVRSTNVCICVSVWPVCLAWFTCQPSQLSNVYGP